MEQDKDQGDNTPERPDEATDTKKEEGSLPPGVKLSEEKSIELSRLKSVWDRLEEEDPKELAELVRSLQAIGVLSPLLVRWDETLQNYIVIAGRRRHAAALKAGLLAVPCRVLEGPSDIATDTLISLVENRIRKVEGPWSQAKKLARCREAGKSFADIVTFSGLAKSTVSVMLYATQMEERYQRQLDRGANLWKVVEKCKADIKARKNPESGNAAPPEPTVADQKKSVVQNKTKGKGGRRPSVPANPEPTNGKAKEEPPLAHPVFYHHEHSDISITVSGATKRTPQEVMEALEEAVKDYHSKFIDKDTN